MSVTVYAADSLLDLFAVIDTWNKCKVESINMSLEDLTLMKNHIEDLELELLGSYKEEQELCKRQQQI